MKLYCYGDSNTYGYDPRGFWENRYDPEDRWCDCLAAKTGWQVLNFGENGRCIPASPWEYAALAASLRETEPDSLVIFLGSNDLLLGLSPEEAGSRMETLVSALGEDFPALPLTLIAPPRIRIPGEGIQEALKALWDRYAALARDNQISYVQTQDLALSPDGVRLSPEGHRMLCDLLALTLRRG